jgi:hypothetical protein
VTLPSVDVAESEMLKFVPAGIPPTRKLIASLF